jgi:acetyl esterase/lipase
MACRPTARMPLDPHVRRLVGALSLGAASLGAASPGAEGDAPLPSMAQRRDAFRGLMRFSDVGAQVAGAEDGELPGPAGPLRMRIYTPADADPDAGLLPGLVFFHGGGLVAGGLDTHDALCRSLCNETGCRLIAVDYRLAPEHVFPAAVEDAYAATVWVFGQAAALGVDPQRIVVAGDSAGGTLAAVVCQRFARLPGPGPAVQLLLCPILDWSGETESRRDLGQGYLLDRALMRQELACYLGTHRQVEHPEVSPLRASDIGRPPRTYIHTAEFDPLRDEGHAYAEKLRSAGGEIHHTCHPGMVHLFYGLGRVVPYAREAHRRIGAEIRAALA